MEWTQIRLVFTLLLILIVNLKRISPCQWSCIPCLMLLHNPVLHTKKIKLYPTILLGIIEYPSNTISYSKIKVWHLRFSLGLGPFFYQRFCSVSLVLTASFQVLISIYINMQAFFIICIYFVQKRHNINI